MSEVTLKMTSGQKKIAEIFTTDECQLFFTCSSCDNSDYSNFWDLLTHLLRVHDIHVLYKDEQIVNQATESGENAAFCEETAPILNVTLKTEPDSEPDGFVSEPSTLSEQFDATTTKKEPESFDLFEAHEMKPEQAQCGNIRVKEPEEDTQNEDLGTEGDTNAELISSYTISTVKRANKSKKTITNGRFGCEMCGLLCKSKKTLSAHIARHSNVKRFACTHCAQRFYTTTEAALHELRRHGSRDHVCAQCGRGFSYSYDLTTHVTNVHGERQYKCEFCHRTFSTKYHLASHNERQYCQPKYICSCCNLTFSSSIELSRHKKHTALDSNLCMERF